MDDLKQSVQNAVYEQKDPLLIYKFESFELFKKMLNEINKDTMSFLFKGQIPVQETQAQVKPAQAPKQDLSKLKLQHDEYRESSGSENSAASNSNGDALPQQKQQPVRAEVKVGRNDPCPCGSGKKFKNCHGALVEN
jgi:preprotein translocase subunit SecA